MRLIDRITGNQGGENRDLSLSDYMNFFSVNGNTYALNQTLATGGTEILPNDFRGYAHVYKSNPIVFACILARLSVFSEARFAWRRMRGGQPQDLFGNADLAILERPDRNMTTGGLITRMEQDGSIAGNAYDARITRLTSDRIVRLKPQHVTIVLGTPNAGVEDPSDDPEVQVIGYLYDPKKGQGSPRMFLPDEVSHFAPIPDPEANFRGMSWLTPVLREVDSDTEATRFKGQFYRNGASPNLVVTLDKEVGFDKFLQFKEAFEAEHSGALNAFKTMFLGAGADAKVIGSSFEQMAYTGVQAAGENRVAIASGVPSILIGLQAGLDASTYSNLGSARRILADKVARPWWREAASSLETLVPRPPDARLDVDTENIAFLRDDAKDVAEVQMGQAGAIKQLTEAGFEPDSVVDAVTSNDMARLKGNHTGAQSVQLLPPATNGSNGDKPALPAATN